MKIEHKMNVFLRNGRSYLGRRFVEDSAFADENGNLVRFFANDTDSCIIVIPMDLVARLEIYQEKVLE